MLRHMYIRMCAAKIHRATVTGADLNYVGSITIDETLLEASGIKPYQMVMINNLSNAASWQTYALAGKRDNGDIILNGPPARLFQTGDIVVILAEAYIEPEKANTLESKIVFVDGKNKITKIEKHKNGG